MLDILRSPKNPSTANSVGFAALEESNPFVTAASVACAFRSVSLIRTSASKTSTRTTAPFVAKTCSRLASPHRTCPAGTPFTLTASANSRDSIIAAPFAKRLSSVNSPWPRRGKPGPGTLPNTPCRPICNALSISCVTTVKPNRTSVSGIFSVSSVPDARPLIRSWNKS